MFLKELDESGDGNIESVVAIMLLDSGELGSGTYAP
jgi:hypothetical protein